YYKWCKQHHFKSMLKDDIAARAACRKNTQPTLDPHMQALPPKDTAIPYSDGQLRSAAITWMITTDQPLSAIEEPTFINMLNVAARA
ncbi:hypothetical protein CERSUDRAFT_38146, partial [Gelatoporia subvermispora B]